MATFVLRLVELNTFLKAGGVAIAAVPVLRTEESLYRVTGVSHTLYGVCVVWCIVWDNDFYLSLLADLFYTLRVYCDVHMHVRVPSVANYSITGHIIGVLDTLEC